MRERLWHNLQNAKFKATYLCELSKRATIWGNLYSFVLAFGTAGSVAAWAVWESFPVIWAVIVGISQFLHVAKPYIPFLKTDKEFMELSFKYESLYLCYEKLWFVLENEKEDEDSIEEQFYVLRDTEFEFLNNMKHIYIPDFVGLAKRTSSAVAGELSHAFQ